MRKESSAQREAFDKREGRATPSDEHVLLIESEVYRSDACGGEGLAGRQTIERMESVKTQAANEKRLAGSTRRMP